MPTDTLIRPRFASQLLSTVKSTANRSATMVVEHLLAVQAQDQLGMRLSVRRRFPGSTRADIDNRLNDGSLVVGWLNRGTLHLVRAGLLVTACDYHPAAAHRKLVATGARRCE